ncbi:MAG: WD40/YVTN/BNR-like repeat-containing protein [Halobacteriaceae archaeon]
MVLIIGTQDGIYQVDDGEQINETTKIADVGSTMRVRTFDSTSGVFAATKTGLYHSTDGGQTWNNLDLPKEEAYSIAVTPDGNRLFAGTHPAHLYQSTDNGKTWTELESFQDLPSRDQWHTPRHRNEAHVRSLDIAEDMPTRVIAGVEVGGVHISDDRGQTWEERKEGVHDDVHHVEVIDGETFVASCGGGLYWTDDGGQTWHRRDTSVDQRYFREALYHNGTLYTAAASGPPGTWSGPNGADAGLFVSTDNGQTLTPQEYPGHPEEVILAWTTKDGDVWAGTNDGRIIRQENGVWIEMGSVPSYIRSLTTL